MPGDDDAGGRAGGRLTPGNVYLRAMAFIRSISGLRATLGDDLTPSSIAQYATAFATVQDDGPIVVGRDGRPSGEWIEGIVVNALRACGRTVRIAGVVPTPTVQLLVEHSSAAGGIIITASHNPAEWNGLKFLGSDGVFLDGPANERMWSVVDDQSGLLESRQLTSRPEIISDAIQQHIDRVMRLDVVKGAPQAQGETVVVDAVNASGSVIVPQLLREFGYDVVELYTNGSGEFPHTPEPVPANLGDLAHAVREHKAAFGVAVDPDADRLVLVDGRGEPIGEEMTISLAAQSVLASGEKGSVVVNYSTTRTVDDVSAHYGVAVHRAPVGEINVVNKMREVHAVIGGEGSGGVIYPACHMGRDSIVGLGLITSLLRKRGQTLKEAVDALPHHAMVKTKIQLADRSLVPSALNRCAAHLNEAVISKEDGVHASWPDKWVHIRASNTEPIMRVIAEAQDAAMAAELIAGINAVLDTPNVEHN